MRIKKSTMKYIRKFHGKLCKITCCLKKKMRLFFKPPQRSKISFTPLLHQNSWLQVNGSYTNEQISCFWRLHPVPWFFMMMGALAKSLNLTGGSIFFKNKELSKNMISPKTWWLMTSSWCHQMCINGKVNQGPLFDISVWCNRSLKTKLHPMIVRQYSHLNLQMRPGR